MATWTFSAGVAVSVLSVGDAGPGLDNQITFAVDVTATVWANSAGTIPVTVLDLNDAPSVVRAGPRGLFSPFATNTNLPSGGVWLRWGAGLPLQFLPSDQAMNSLPQALAAQTSAAAAVTRAESIATSLSGLPTVLSGYVTQAQLSSTVATLVTDAELVSALTGITPGDGGIGGPGEPTIPGDPNEPEIVDPTTPPATMPEKPPAPLTATRTFSVSTVAALRTRLADLTMGDRINLTGAVFAASDTDPAVVTRTNSSGNAFTASATFVINTPKGLSGMTAAQAKAAMPVIKGVAGQTILRNTRNLSGYTLFLDQAHYVRLEDLIVDGGEKGLMVHGTTYNEHVNVTIKNTGHEGYHLRNNSHHNLAWGCVVDTTGLSTADFGEAYYFGMANTSRTAAYSMVSSTGMDRSDYNRMINCSALNFTAEAVDVKEMTTGNYIGWCNFNGSAIAGLHSADGYVDIKGNDTVIEYCVGTNPSTNVLHGAETHILLSGWGNRNIWRRNNFVAGGKPTSNVINIQETGSRGTAVGNIVYSDNTGSGAPAGLTNITVTNNGNAGTGTPIDSGTPGDPTASPRSWLTPYWRLHAPLPNAAGTSLLEIHNPALSTTYTSPWFTVTGSELVLTQRADAYASSGSTYGRSELRETKADGTNAAWLTNTGYHVLEVSQAVLEISANKPRVILMQIHNGDDLVTLRMDSNGAGGYQLAFLYEDGLAAGQAVVVNPNYILGTWYTASMVVWDGIIHCYYNGTKKAQFTDLDLLPSYFKTGTYMLTRTGLTSYVNLAGQTVNIAAEPASSYAKVGLKAPKPTHASAPPPVIQVPADNTGGGTGGGTTDLSAYVQRVELAAYATDVEMAAGLQGKANQATIDAATPEVVANSLVRRDNSSKIRVGTPTAPTDAATKGYVDAIGVAVPTPSTVVRRDTVGRFQTVDPAAGQDVSTKAYTDTKASLTQVAGMALRSETVGVVTHGSTASVVRPSGYASIMWIGSVAPANAIDSMDTWLDTSAP